MDLLRVILSKTDKGLSDVIKEDITEFKPTLFVNKIMDLETKQKISESMMGNQNAKKKPFTEQMKRFIVQNPQKMEKIIEGLFQEAENKNLTAVGMIIAYNTK